jgi:hypothetical protein
MSLRGGRYLPDEVIFTIVIYLVHPIQGVLLTISGLLMSLRGRTLPEAVFTIVMNLARPIQRALFVKVLNFCVIKYRERLM